MSASRETGAAFLSRARQQVDAHAAIRTAAYWLAPLLLCLALHWREFNSWFRADDFAWLAIGPQIHNFRELASALFSPMAQGSIRPWSERVVFIAGFALFGLESLPFRIVIFATQFANLALVAAIGRRITGSRSAGFWASVLWVINSSLVLPLGWACVYNQVLCGFFLLLAFYFLLRSIEAAKRGHSGLAKRYELLEWITFLLGFGAQELNAVFPAVAVAYTFLCARDYFRRALPLVAPSVVYVVIHAAVTPAQTNPDYVLHFTGAMIRTLIKYWTWSVGPTRLWMPVNLPKFVLLSAITITSLAVLGFAAAKMRAGNRAPLFGLAWYALTIAPVLPLRDHVTEYYVYLPAIGLCWLGGWALAQMSDDGRRWSAPRAIAGVVAGLYAAMAIPNLLGSAEWNYRISTRVRNVVEGVARAYQLHPGKAIVLEGVDTDLFWNGFADHPYRLIGVEQIYLAPGSEKHIDAHPDLGDIGEFVLPADAVWRALERDELVVYDASGPRLRNITSAYAARSQPSALPQRVDAAGPLTAYLLGPEWYPRDGNHRWMPARASLRLGAPAGPGQKLYIRGKCADEQLRSGPLTVTVTVDGARLPPAEIHPGESEFELGFPLPASVAGKQEMAVAIEVSRTFRPASDPRDLGLAFGVFEVR